MALPSSLTDREQFAFTEDVNLDVAKRVVDRELNDTLDSIASAVGSTSSEARFLESFVGQTNPGNLQTVIDFTLGAGISRRLLKIDVITDASAKYFIKLNGSIIGSGRTGPSNPESTYNWKPVVTISAGDQIVVEFTSNSFEPQVRDVEVYLTGTEF